MPGLVCPQCAQATSAQEVDVDRLIAECLFCFAVFDFRAQLGPAPSERTDTRHPIPPPEGVRILETSDRIEITIPWMTRELFFQGLTWAAIAVIGVGSLAKLYQAIGLPLGLCFLAFATALAAPLLLGGLYIVLAHFLNQTVILGGDGALAVRHGPLFWWLPRKGPITDLDQLFCRAIPFFSLGSGYYCKRQRYGLFARLKSGEEVCLFQGMPDPEQVWFVEQRLEQRLGITDRAVTGEFQ